MNKFYFGAILAFFIILNTSAQDIVDCNIGPISNNFCYASSVNESFTYTSSDGSSLNLVINSGNVEVNWDEFIVLDSDGTELYNGYGNAGDLSGFSFQSSGDTITLEVTPDGSVDCQGSTGINPIDYTVSCATCTNPQVTFQLIDDCVNAPQFFVEADVTDLGSAADLDISDNQGSPVQTVSVTGIVSFGPYPNGTVVELTAVNNQDANCEVVSGQFTQDLCTTTVVDCMAGPVNTVFCYSSGVLEEYTYVSSDGSSLNLIVNSGNVENNWDEFIVLDTDGTELFNGYGNAGDLSGLNFQSTGDTITIQVTPDGSIDCQGSGAINPIDLTVSCATCVNPQVNYQLIDDCINAPQFFVEADVVDLGSATDLDISDNQGNPPQTASSTGILTFGPYPNGTVVELIAVNNQDANCQSISPQFTQDVCTTVLVDCTAGPLNTVFCYDSGINEEFTFVSSDGSPLNLVVNSGNVENNFDEFIVLDSDGTELFNGYGNGGDLTGLNFQSSGDTLIVQVTPDGSIDCQGSGIINPIDLTVSCATCTNPQVNFQLIDDCLNAPQFFVEADVVDLGSATDLDISDNQGSAVQTVSATGIVTFGPYPNGTVVELTAINNQDVNCQAFSGQFTQDFCTTTLVDCTAGPVNTVFCYDSGIVEEFIFVSSDGSPLNLVINSGNVENNFDELIILDSDGSEIYNDYGNTGDLSGLSFQSTGGTITLQVTPDGSISCQSSGNINPIDFTVSCATCVNPQVDYNVIGDCTNGNEQFNVEVEIIDIGSASSLDITSNQGDPVQNVTTPTTLIYGPYALGTDVIFTVENVDDVNCTLTSPPQNLLTCGCFGAEPFCAPAPGQALIFPNVDDSSGTVADPNLSNYGCLATQPNPVWYFLQIDQAGELVFEIVQNTQFDAAGNPVGTPLDVDFIAWGPFTDTQFCNDLDSCDNCGSNTFDNNYPYGNVIDCSYSAAPVETFTIPNAQTGEIYAVLITNFNGDPGFISLGQINSDDTGSGSTDCDIVLFNQVVACEGEDVILDATDTTADQYQWLVFDEALQDFTPIAGENTPTLTVNQPGTYQILTLNGTEISTEEFAVTFIESPDNNLVDTVSICSNSVITLDATVLNLGDYDSISYQWYLEGSPIAGEVQPTLNVSVPGNYSIEYTTTSLNVDTDGNDLTCVSVFNIIVTSADFTIDLGGNQTFCPSDATNLETITANVIGADPGNATYLWNTNETTSSIDVNSTGTYEVTITIDGCSVTESVIYTFAEEPLFDLGDDQNLCEGQSITLDATVSNSSDFTAVEYLWSNETGIITGETQNTLNVNLPGTYSVEISTTTVTADNQLFVCTAIDTIVIDGAIFNVDLGGDQSFCDAEPQTITASVVGTDATNATYLWSTSETTDSITVNNSGEYTVTVTINGCPVTESVIYTFNESPILELGPDSSICDLSEFVLDATPSNANGQNVNYSWSFNGNPLNVSTATLNPDDFGYGTYQVEVYFDDPTCSTSDTIVLELRNDIQLSITSDDQDNLFCPSEFVTLTAVLNNAMLAEADFMWTVNGEVQTEMTNVLSNYQIPQQNSSSSLTVTVVATIGQDCILEESIALNYYDVGQCVITQGLSTGTVDGRNDKLDLRFLDDRSGISSLEIFNRYGQRVYKKDNYRDEFFGQSDNGNMLETGTYFYVIKFDRTDDTYGAIHKGWIYINREQ